MKEVAAMLSAGEN